MGKIWGGIILIASVYAILMGRVEVLLDGILSIPDESFSFLLIVISSTVFWTGFMYIFKEVGIIDFISLAIRPLFKKIMPNLTDQEAIEYLSMNIAANMFGLGFAATPSGLKGIKRLKEISTMPEGVASDEMITFLVLNTAGVTLVPTTVISILVLKHRPTLYYLRLYRQFVHVFLVY